MVGLQQLVRKRQNPALEWWCGRKWPAAVLLLGAVLTLFTQWDGRYAPAIFAGAALFAACEIAWQQLKPGNPRARMISVLLLFVLLGGMAAGVALLWMPYGRQVIVIVAAATFCNDIGAQVCGKAWRRICTWTGFEPTPIFPVASPNKTWAGTWGGTLVGTGAGVTAFALMYDYWGPLPWWLLAIAIATPPCAVLGDLIESVTKRALGIKDFGWTLGGAGGFCDRIDAIAAALMGAVVQVVVVKLVTVVIAWLLVLLG